jgi:hypothetical protein
MEARKLLRENEINCRENMHLMKRRRRGDRIP